MIPLLLFFLSIISITTGRPHEGKRNGEPICSKFDYEEKLLEKVIRMELKMEKIKEEVENKENKVMSIATDLKQRVENTENSAGKFQSGVNQTMTEYVNIIKDEKTKLNVLAEKTSLPMIGFNVRLSLTKTVNTGNKVVYDTIILNQGEGYDSSSGMFTAPYTGFYFFSAHVCNHGNKDVQYAIYQESVLLTISTQYDNGGVYSCSSVSTVAMVNKAERVWVQSLDTSIYYVDGRRWNTFTGVLLNRELL